MDELWLRGTVRLALVAYLLRLARDLGLIRLSATDRRMQSIWLAGSVLLLAHALVAFGAVHGWSHARAYDHTARQTRELTSLDWGGGLYLNELTIALWLFDALWCCLLPASYEGRSPRVGAVLHGWLLFMAINGAIVFEPGPTRWIALGVLASLAVALAISKARRRHGGVS